MSDNDTAADGAVGAPTDRYRRSLLVGMSGTALASLTSFKMAHGMEDAHGMDSAHGKEVGTGGATPAKYQKLAAHDAVKVYPALHHGKGKVDIRFFFRTSRTTGAAEPALLMEYRIPSGASEGVHTHRLGDPVAGSFDEFYYIVEGSGEMQIDGEKVLVGPGDCVFTPNGVAHGIENTARQGDLLLHLVAMRRA